MVLLRPPLAVPDRGLTHDGDGAASRVAGCGEEGGDAPREGGRGALTSGWPALAPTGSGWSVVLLWAVVPCRQTGPAAESEGEGQGHGRAAEETRIAQLAAAREGPSPAKELTTAQAEETASLGLGSAAILYARCTPDPGGGGVVRETRRAGERGDARAFEYSLVAPAGSQGLPAPLRRRCPPGRCSGGALVTPRRRLRPEGRGLGPCEQRGRERDGARLPNEPHGLRLGRRGHLLGRGGGRDGEVGRGKR